MNAVGYTVHSMNGQDREEALTLELLQAIEQQSDLSQRSLAQRLGIALGLANSYLKRCVRKGLIKIQQVPPNRYLYYLTPTGFKEKSRLTAQYLVDSLNIFRRASEGYDRIFRECAASGHRRLVLCGLSDLAEIAAIRARGFKVDIVGILDPLSNQHEFLHMPVWRKFDEVTFCDAVVFTALARPEEMFRYVAQAKQTGLPVLIPDFLDFVRSLQDEGALGRET